MVRIVSKEEVTERGWQDTGTEGIIIVVTEIEMVEAFG
jgi:hypothetical protein